MEPNEGDLDKVEMEHLLFLRAIMDGKITDEDLIQQRITQFTLGKTFMKPSKKIGHKPKKPK